MAHQKYATVKKGQSSQISNQNIKTRNSETVDIYRLDKNRCAKEYGPMQFATALDIFSRDTTEINSLAGKPPGLTTF